MRRYAVVRTLSILPTLFGVSVAVFLLIRLIPGTVVDQMIGTEGTYSVDLSVAKALQGPRDDVRGFIILGAKY